MLMPADNNLVCMCESCVNNGNSKLNASPAVFKLINKLAQKFPHFQIFSTAYVTTNNPPSFQLEKNAGVMLSTMSFPKGIVYEKTNYKSTIEGTLKSWKSVTKTIYVWDYGIHFDLYLSSYPSLLIHQENIQFFKKNGITGIFMQGNEESFAAFEGLKYFVYAQLMLNPETDVRALIRFYLEGQFPKAGTVLANYYLEIEERALNSKHEMDIYGGWNQQLKKYLSFQPLKNLMLELEELESKTSKDELDELKTLKIAFNFQLLEIMRVNGIGNEGYAYINKSGEKQIKPEVKQMVGKIEQLKQETKFDILNESHVALSNYIEFWYSEVFQKKIQILVPDLKIKAISKLDEDYSDLNILTNGKVGFLDYDNNWLITTGQALHLEIDPKSALGSKTFSIRLLQDLKHGIYFPQKIQLTIGKEIYTAEIPRDELKKALTTYAIQIPIKKFKIEDKMSVLMIKQMEFKNKSTACGELQFTKR